MPQHLDIRFTDLRRLHQYDRQPRTPDEAAAILASACGCTETREPASAFAVNAEAPVSAITWSGTLVIEGELTGDGRIIEANALRWDNLPLPLRWAAEDVGGHDGAKVVGRILTMAREKDGRITATGDFDAGSPEGREAARQVEERLTPGVSVDLDSVSFEVRVAKDVLEEVGLLAPSEPEDGGEESSDPEVDEDGRVKVMDFDADDEIMVTTEARVRAATLVAIPAFAGARIELDEAAPAEESEESEDDGEVAEVVAIAAGGAIPAEPPAEWFSDPNLTEPTPLVITPEGRVFGHLATWGTCHIGFTNQCVEPPHSESGYAYFRRGTVLTAEGSEVATGTLTFDTLHAGKSLSATATLAHYENTGTAAADLAAGEDAHGIWVAGALRPGITDEQLRVLRAAPISGDWRRIGAGLELVGALSVNVPGFPVPRPSGLVASGVMTSLVASGMLAPHKVLPPGSAGALNEDDLRYLKRLAARERRAEAEEVAGIQSAADALAARMRATRVKEMARGLGLPVA